MKESVKHLIETITADTGAYMQTFQHKFITYAGSTSAIYQLRERLENWLPDWLTDPISSAFVFLSNFPMMDFLSGTAVLLLVIERGFIIHGKITEHRAKRRAAKGGA